MTDHSLSADVNAAVTAQLDRSRDTEMTELTFRLGSEPPIEGFAIERGTIRA